MRDTIFKYRGWLFIPAALVVLYLAKPTLTSLIVGLSISFFIGEGIRVWAVGYTGVTTRDDKVVAPMLITAGPYAYIRNPLYLGNLISWLGFCVAASGGVPLWAGFIMFSSVLISYLIIYGSIIPLEEEYLKETFGEPFDEYMKHVPRLFPRVKPYENQQGGYDSRVILKAEMHTIIMLLALAVLMVLKFANVISINLPY